MQESALYLSANLELGTRNYSDQIPLHQLVPTPLRFQYQLADFAHGAVAARETRDVVGRVARVGRRVGDGDAEAGAEHERDVYHVVADVRDFGRRDRGLCEQRVEDRELVERALSHVSDAEACGARLDEPGGSPRNDAGAEAQIGRASC